MFVRKLQEEAEKLFQEYICICNQPLGGDKVRDHCHIVGTIVMLRIVGVI